MASTSSTAADSNHDVFISHRGPDVKKTFASHLYHRLRFHGITAFLDKPELQPGEKLTSQIEGAIRSASVHVAIFSSGYADSEWCLNELLLMLESKSPIIPVFYKDVKPADLRWTRDKKGTYAEALEKLEKKTSSDPITQELKLRYASPTIEKWRDALFRVSMISGFELAAFDGDDGELLNKVVDGVLKMVGKPALDVADYPTGLDDKVCQLTAFLRFPIICRQRKTLNIHFPGFIIAVDRVQHREQTGIVVYQGPPYMYRSFGRHSPTAACTFAIYHEICLETALKQGV